MEIYIDTYDLEPIIMTGKERDVIVHILKNAKISTFTDAFTTVEVVNRLEELKTI